MELKGQFHFDLLEHGFHYELLNAYLTSLRFLFLLFVKCGIVCYSVVIFVLLRALVFG
jgi:hypothetical protein